MVIKLSSDLMANKEKRINHSLLANLVEQIAELHHEGIMSVLVTSGAVVSGQEDLNNQLKTKDEVIRKQVFSAVGQPRMMRNYYNIFLEHGIRCAQVLATKRDFEPGLHRENMINCYEGLLSQNIIPIANEDHAVSLAMSCFSNNNELASLVAELIDADMLITLTQSVDIKDKVNGKESDETSVLESQEHRLENFIQEFSTGVAEMTSSLGVINMTSQKEIPSFLADGKIPKVILEIVNGFSLKSQVTA
ncbi:glutamate 5-kinase [Echinicola jeungdonensis]|uniref:Glutamate 5-kinase n=1 Tax=Echinicola jeungdonensis TaxID=709343 RepID=A0ABV5J311_9BACT